MKSINLNKRWIFGLIAILALSFAGHAQSKKKVEEIRADANVAKEEFLKADWKMEKHFNEAYGYAIFPNVGKGAIGIGGAAGNGNTASCRRLRVSRSRHGFHTGKDGGRRNFPVT